MKSFSFLLFFCAVVQVGFAQPVNERYFHILPGYASQEGRDVGMSPLAYSGNHFMGIFGFERRTAKSIHKITVLGMTGRMHASTQPKGVRSIIKANRFQLDYSYRHVVKKWKDETVRLYVGGAWNTLGNTRYHTRYGNNAWNYDISASLGATVALFYHFKLGTKQFLFHTGMELPLVAFNVRPAYGSSIPEGFIGQEGGNVKAFFKSGEVQSFNCFFRLIATHNIEYVLFNGNRLLLGYTWDFYSMQRYHRVQMASHQITAGWAFRF